MVDIIAQGPCKGCHLPQLPTVSVGASAFASVTRHLPHEQALVCLRLCLLGCYAQTMHTLPYCINPCTSGFHNAVSTNTHSIGGYRWR